MLEQGDNAAPAHRALLEWLVRRAPGAEVVLVGPLMAAAAAGTGLRALPDAAAAAEYVRRRVAPGLWVFVKGSRGLRLEAVLPPREASAP
jgi:UDP-N-acetylmuramoyl-tripeptide--D-alanyl-D-alanine ligase